MAVWTIAVCPECDALIEQDDGAWACEHRVMAHEGETVEVVPAGDCNRYREALEEIRDGVFSGNQAAAWARKALDSPPTGGQL